jgi:uncharacterized protein
MQTNSTILITGGTGLVGSHLCRLLSQKGYRVHVYTRNARSQKNEAGVSYFDWNPAQGTYEAAALQGVNAVVNLAGAGVADKRWSATRKKEILDSRVQAGQTLVKALDETANTVQTIVQASAQGWYGDDTEASRANGGFEEASFPATDYLGGVCKAWEESVKPLADMGRRIVYLRIGIVLAREGGMVKELEKGMRFGLAPVFGNGRQTVSWIHVADLCGMILHAIETPALTGAYNAAAPQPVAQKLLVNTMARARQRFFIPAWAPGFMMRLLVGEMSVEILRSITLSTKKIQKTGYVFAYPAIENAMAGLFRKN